MKRMPPDAADGSKRVACHPDLIRAMEATLTKADALVMHWGPVLSAAAKDRFNQESARAYAH